MLCASRRAFTSTGGLPPRRAGSPAYRSSGGRAIPADRIAGRLARRMRRAWRAVTLAPPNDGWFLWRSRAGPNAGRAGTATSFTSARSRNRCPPHSRPQLTPPRRSARWRSRSATTPPPSCGRTRSSSTSLTSTASPAAAARLSAELAGCPSHGVPFTAELADCDGLLSFGIDPPRSEHALEWQERESWRLWLTNRLAVALVSARRDGGPLEPWQYALARIEFDGIDPSTWAPAGDLWAEAA